MTAEVASTVIVALLSGGFVTGIGQLVTALRARGRTEAETEGVIVSSAERVVTLLRAELDEAHAAARSSRDEADSCRRAAAACRSELALVRRELAEAKRRLAALERTRRA